MNNIEIAKTFIAQAIGHREANSNESVMRENLISYLRPMFGSETKWVRDHIAGSEFHVHLIRNQRKVSGFVDNCIDSITIEYERNLKVATIFEEGYRQVKEYCASLIQEGAKISLVQGILSDTLTWHVYQVVPVEGMDATDYQADNIQLKEVESLDITEPSDENAIRLLQFLPKYLGRQKSRSVTAESIAADFGFYSNYSQTYLKILEQHVRKRTEAKPEYFQMINVLWKKFVDQFETYSDERSSFISEYYVSIIAKILCANFLSKGTVSFDDNTLLQIVNGRYFENLGYQNFVEYDYFGWLNEVACVREILPVLRDIQSEFIVYDFDVVPQEDLFGEIMVQMSHRTQRLMLGQELTPHQLARELVNHVYHQLPEGTHPHFIDMCCGSGSMIVETTKIAISLITPDMDSQQVSQLVSNSITGIDIDPLAVILSKINWMIHIAQVLPPSSDVTIPIYHADSLFLNTPVTQGEIFNEKILRMRMFDRQLDLPVYLVSPDNQLLFDRIVDKCYDAIHLPVMEEENFRSVLDHILETTACHIHEDQVEAVKTFGCHLYANMCTLNAEGRNGIWSFLIKNSFRPGLLGENFNGIVSNTPWLALSKIADNPYKNSLYAVSDYYGIKPSGSAFLHTEMATVFLLHAIDKYLMNGAPFGCILPHSVLSGRNHEKFRSGYFSTHGCRVRAYFNEIWELPTDVFKNKAIALFGTKERFKSTNQMTGRKYITTDRYKSVTWNTHRTNGRTAWSQKEQTLTGISGNSYHFEEGADVMPRYLFFFDLAETEGGYAISSISPMSRYAYFLQNMHIGQHFSLSANWVGKNLFHPVLLSNIVTPFHISEPPLALIPIQKNEEGRWEEFDSVAMASLRRSEKNVLNGITEEYRLLKKEPSVEMFQKTVNLRNKLVNQSFSAGKFLVVYGAGGSFTCAAYLLLNTENKNVIVDQTLYWELVDTEDEALFLTGLLNSDCLADAIAAYQPQGLFGRRHIHTLPTTVLPQFNPQDSLHNNVVNAVRTLMRELNDYCRVDGQTILNPNTGTITSRRKKIKTIITRLTSYQRYYEVCNAVLNPVQ